MEAQCCPITFASSGQKQRKCCRTARPAPLHHPPHPHPHGLNDHLPLLHEGESLGPSSPPPPLHPIPQPLLVSNCFTLPQIYSDIQFFDSRHKATLALTWRTEEFVVLLFSSPVAALCHSGTNLLSGGLCCLLFGPCWASLVHDWQESNGMSHSEDIFFFVGEFGVQPAKLTPLKSWDLAPALKTKGGGSSSEKMYFPRSRNS